MCMMFVGVRVCTHCSVYVTALREQILCTLEIHRATIIANAKVKQSKGKCNCQEKKLKEASCPL